MSDNVNATVGPEAGAAINMREGGEWGIRMLLGRRPTEADAPIWEGCSNAEELRARFLALPELQQWPMWAASRPDDADEEGLDFTQGVRWSSRLGLRRELSDEEVAMHAPSMASVKDLRSVFRSREFEARSPDALFLSDLSTFRSLSPLPEVKPSKAFCTNFLGAKTRIAFLHPDLAWKEGTVEPIPSHLNPSLHGIGEWVGSLRSVLEAKDRFVMMELGAGWGPWLMSCAKAAELRGITDLRLIGVEADPHHYEFLVQNFLDNGLDPSAHLLRHAIVGVEDGFAEFPVLHDPRSDYGAGAVFDEGERDSAEVRGRLERIECVGLANLIRQEGRVDLLHIDIQGHEQVVLESAIGEMNEFVHRAVVGCHSRAIDAALIELFSSNGWYLEYEVPTRAVQNPDLSFHYPVDGEQIWVNTRV
jgi:FkbM family methyltransferase